MRIFSNPESLHHPKVYFGTRVLLEQWRPLDYSPIIPLDKVDLVKEDSILGRDRNPANPPLLHCQSILEKASEVGDDHVVWFGYVPKRGRSKRSVYVYKLA
ncbi:hypothetical protein AVEN_242504-1 [Araneus ventricosus]|uniref:Uncharacterized protein n=1 Tax=Araneus ventricosus TaxID=182803 RepID=A0A4Y2SAY1_ARAVE|nr:hypothetical protein AVEN_242504-1 [Araneus ventricosus]